MLTDFDFRKFLDLCRAELGVHLADYRALPVRRSGPAESIYPQLKDVGVDVMAVERAQPLSSSGLVARLQIGGRRSWIPAHED